MNVSLESNESSFGTHCSSSEPCEVLDALFKLSGIPQALFYIFIVVASLFGNVVVIKTVVQDPEMSKSYSNIFLVNLALCDIAQSMLMLPIFGTSVVLDHSYIFPKIFGHDIICSVSIYLNQLCPAVTSYTNTIIAVDRFVAFVYPFRKRITKLTAVLIMGMTWISSMLFCTGLFSKPSVVEDCWTGCRKQICINVLEPESRYLGSLAAYLLLVFIAPCVVISVAYGRTGCILMRDDVGGADDRHMQSKRKAVRMFMAVVTMFLLTRLPVFLTYALLAFNADFYERHENLCDQLLNFVHVVYMASTTVNPVIYCLMNEKFTKAFKKAFCCSTEVERQAPVQHSARPHRNNRQLLLAVKFNQKSAVTSQTEDSTRLELAKANIINSGKGGGLRNNRMSTPFKTNTDANNVQMTFLKHATEKNTPKLPRDLVN